MKFLRLAVPLACLAFSLQAQDAKVELLPGTAPLNWPEEDLSERLMDGAHAFVERKIGESKEKRARFWNYDFYSPEAFEKSIAPNQERFRKLIGVVDERVSPVTMEKFGEGEIPGLVAETDDYKIWQVRWPVLEGVWSEGLLVEPIEARLKERPGCAIVVPDADMIPEVLAGLAEGDSRMRKTVTGLAKDGTTVIIPALIDRTIYLGPSGDDPRLKRSDQSHREWIYRQAFQMGRHIIGYEVQKILAAVDWWSSQSPESTVMVHGADEGALLAFFAGACDRRIRITSIHGYFGEREANWSEPIYRNLFGLLNEFGDAEIATLIRPFLLIDAPVNPEIPDQKGVPQSYRREAVRIELDRIPEVIREKVMLIDEREEKSLPIPIERKPVELIKDRRKSYSSKARHDRLFRQLEEHVQSLVRKSNDVREEFFLFQAEPKLRPGKWSTNKEHPTLDPANFIENARSFREKFEEEAMGKFDEPLAPPKPRTRKILETEKWTAWDVVLDVYAPEFFAWGTLLLPKDLKPGEKRPVVVCQHGRNGVPRDCVDAGSSAYNDFAAKLAERGFITFAPHNLYRGEDRYRWLDRKANSIGGTLFSFIIPSHRQILDWLKNRPNVDPDRIAFYGLSYGGETAMRVPPVIEDYAVVICSGDFNQWTRKVAAVDFPGSFMNTIEWEMPYWNLGNTFDYAEMAYLIFPRPFMVERGHHDRVSRDHWVAHEYAKVRWLYAQFGMADKTEIEYFQGGHSINGKGTFDFLHKHLDWPKP